MVVLAGVGRVGFVGGGWHLCSRDERDVSAAIGGCFVGRKFLLPVYFFLTVVWLCVSVLLGFRVSRAFVLSRLILAVGLVVLG